MIDLSGPAEWSASYAQYLVRTTSQSARALDLHYLVLQRVASGAISADAVSAELTAVLERRGREYSERMAGATLRLIEGLAQAAVGAEGPPPRLAPDDPEGWARAFAGYASREASRAGATTAHANGGRPEPAAMVAAVARLYLEFVAGLTGLTMEFEEEYLRAALALAHARPESGIALEAVAGVETSAFLLVENTRPEPSRVRCAAAAVRRADGVGPSFVPGVLFHPGELTLAPAGALEVRVSVILDPAVFDPGTPYVGHLHLLRDGAERVDVPLRILATTGGPEATPAHGGLR